MFAVAATGALLCATAAPASAAFPGRNGLIAYQYKGNIYTIAATGGTPKRLTQDGNSEHPAWSPRGDRIAFNRKDHLFVMSADGAGQRQVTAALVESGNAPTWSADSSQLAFAGTDGNLYRVPLAGGPPIRLTHDRTQPCHPADLFPNWSPASTEIVYIRRCYSGGFRISRITLLNIRSLTETTLANLQSDADTPAFTPDGQKIDFISTCANPEPGGCIYQNQLGSNIVQIHRDGTGWTLLTNWDWQSNGASEDPAPSPDGTTFAWALLDYGNPDHIVIGPNPYSLLAVGNAPDWQPLPRA